MGTDYYTLTWDPIDVAAPQHTISVASFDAETNIVIDLPSGASVIYAGVTYNESTPLRVTIRRWATFHLMASVGVDLTGAYSAHAYAPRVWRVTVRWDGVRPFVCTCTPYTALVSSALTRCFC